MDAQITAIQEQVGQVVDALAQINAVVGRINETQQLIGGVLTEQTAVTKEILG